MERSEPNYKVVPVFKVVKTLNGIESEVFTFNNETDAENVVNILKKEFGCNNKQEVIIKVNSNNKIEVPLNPPSIKQKGYKEKECPVCHKLFKPNSGKQQKCNSCRGYERCDSKKEKSESNKESSKEDN